MCIFLANSRQVILYHHKEGEGEDRLGGDDQQGQGRSAGHQGRFVLCQVGTGGHLTTTTQQHSAAGSPQQHAFLHLSDPV